MTTELLENVDNPISFEPSCLPASASVSIVNRKGQSVASPVVSIDSIGINGVSTIQAIVSGNVLTVDDATGISPGQTLWLDSQSGQGCPVSVSTVSGSTITLTGAPAASLTAGDALRGMTLRATVSGAVLNERGLFWSIRWSIVDINGNSTIEQESAHVVRQRFISLPASLAAETMGRYFPGATKNKSSGYYQELANRATERIRTTLMSKGTYPHLSGDPKAFHGEAGRTAILTELALFDGLRGPGMAGMTNEEIEKACRLSIYRIADSLHWNDINDDGAVTEDEITKGPIAGSFRFRR